MAGNVIIQDKRDMMTALSNVKQDLSAIRRNSFDLEPVTELSACKGISFKIEQMEHLKEIGALSQCPEWTYGYFRSNENNAKVNNKLYAVDNLLSDVINFIGNCCVTRKIELSEAERAMFTVVIGGNQDSRLVAQLKGGKTYA
jgi:hypothetical protein